MQPVQGIPAKLTEPFGSITVDLLTLWPYVKIEPNGSVTIFWFDFSADSHAHCWLAAAGLNRQLRE